VENCRKHRLNVEFAVGCGKLNRFPLSEARKYQRDIEFLSHHVFSIARMIDLNWRN
jgi:hypothetical protein